jgi:transcription antitermination factor NusG
VQAEDLAASAVCKRGSETVGHRAVAWPKAYSRGFESRIIRDEMSTVKANQPWYALRVKSRFENAVATHLTARGFESFLPMYKSRRRWSDRIRETEVPLFSSYVFCRFDPLDRFPVVSIPGIVNVVSIGKVPTAVDQSEIEAIQATVRSGLHHEPCSYLHIGQKVRIEQGPLNGVEGILLSFKGNQRLILSITLLQRSMAVQIDEAWTRPLDEPTASMAWLAEA